MTDDEDVSAISYDGEKAEEEIKYERRRDRIEDLRDKVESHMDRVEKAENIVEAAEEALEKAKEAKRNEEALLDELRHVSVDDFDDVEELGNIGEDDIGIDDLDFVESGKSFQGMEVTIPFIPQQ